MAFLVGKATVHIRIRFSLFCFWILIPPLPCSIYSITAPFPRSSTSLTRPLSLSPAGTWDYFPHGYSGPSCPRGSSCFDQNRHPLKAVSAADKIYFSDISCCWYLIIYVYHDRALRKCLTRWPTSHSVEHID